MFSPEGLENLLGSNSCCKSLKSIIVAAAGTEVGPIYYCSGLRRSSKKRGGSGISLLIAALIYIEV